MIKNEKNEILIPTNEKFEPFSVVQDGTTYYTPRIVEHRGTAISEVNTYNDALNPTIEGKSEQTVTANSPSPDYPSPIRSSENFDVFSCGKNLFDEERILPTQGWVRQRDGSFFVSNNSIPYGKVLWENTDGYTGQIAITVQQRRIEAGSLYAGAFPSIVYTDGSRSIALDSRDVEWTSKAVISDNTKTVKQIDWSYGTGAIGTYVKDLLIAKSNTIIPYEPYHATTAHVTDPLRSVGDVSDSIEVSGGKVEVVRRVRRVAITSSSDISEHTNRYHNDYVHFRFDTNKRLSEHTLCNILPFVSSSWLMTTECISAEWSSLYPTFAKVTLGISNTDTAAQKVSKLKAWLATHEMYVDWIPAAPTRTDITATPLGQALIALRTQPHYTQVYTDAEIQPILQANIKVVLDDADAKTT